jgi:1-acyl-sn-glycerol-3-phosphate acyltransferase
MAEKIVRALKGFLMGTLFMVFLLGILFLLLVILPLLLILDRILGPAPSRMQGAIRLLVGFWLFLMKGCGLLKGAVGEGKSIDGPCVIVSNHPGLFDVLFLMRDIPRLSLMVKRALATKLPLGPVFRSAGYVLSPDLEQTSPFESLEEAREKINLGYKFMIFPEGTRSPKGKLGKFHAGAFLLARLAKVPIQPLFIKNIPPFLPKKEPWYLPPYRVSSLSVDFWEPLAPPQAGQERELARDLEGQYRKALGLTEKRT